MHASAPPSRWGHPVARGLQESRGKWGAPQLSLGHRCVRAARVRGPLPLAGPRSQASIVPASSSAPTAAASAEGARTERRTIFQVEQVERLMNPGGCSRGDELSAALSRPTKLRDVRDSRPRVKHLDREPNQLSLGKPIGAQFFRPD